MTKISLLLGIISTAMVAWWWFGILYLVPKLNDFRWEHHQYLLNFENFSETITLPIAIIGLVLSLISLANKEYRKMAIYAIILCMIGVLGGSFMIFVSSLAAGFF